MPHLRFQAEPVTAAEVEKIRTAVVDLLLLIERLARGVAAAETTIAGDVASQAYQIALRLAPSLRGREVGEE